MKQVKYASVLLNDVWEWKPGTLLLILDLDLDLDFLYFFFFWQQNFVAWLTAYSIFFK